jgi:hypothetical protein
MEINLHIERVILDGLPFETRQSAVLRAAIETELALLLTRDNAAANWQSGGAVPGVRAEAIQVTAQSSPAQLGKQIAGSVYGSIGKAI